MEPSLPWISKSIYVLVNKQLLIIVMILPCEAVTMIEYQILDDGTKCSELNFLACKNLVQNKICTSICMNH